MCWTVVQNDPSVRLLKTNIFTVKGLFEKPSELRKRRSRYDIYKQIEASYYGYRDDEDEDDVVMEERSEKEREREMQACQNHQNSLNSRSNDDDQQFLRHDWTWVPRSVFKKPDSIILAISPANQHIATFDAIKLATEVDPSGKRAFGVLTKLDMMDEGTNALDVRSFSLSHSLNINIEVLEGRAYRLQHPWVGIMNRSQADINKNTNMMYARQKEWKYFATSLDYGHLANKIGKAKKSVRLMMEKLFGMELELILAKTINGEVQLHALVDGKKIIVTESIVRRDLQLKDAEGIDCLPNSTIFEELTRMGYEKILQNLTFYKVPQPSGPIDIVAYEAIYKELGDNLVRAVTTASSLEVV
ncbi:dynamin-related protein 1E-like protein [Tanacetum coccineum]